VSAIQKIYDELGVRNETAGYLTKYYQQAIDLLDSIETETDKSAIMEMVNYLFNREH
jgi:geranylgeranyl pyrophosphate synthase